MNKFNLKLPIVVILFLVLMMPCEGIDNANTPTPCVAPNLGEILLEHGLPITLVLL
jgi:hypothetical protein